MDEVNNDNGKASQEGETIGTDYNVPEADHPVEMLSVPTKVQDGNYQYEVSPMPASGAHASVTTVPTFFNTLGSGYYVSPMPPTPTEDGIDLNQTPSSCISKDTNTLAALYQSSRRSRRDSTMPTPTNYTDARSSTLSSRRGFLPPPPLASASPKPELTSFDATTNVPSSFHESCSALIGSMADFPHARPTHDSDHIYDESQQVQATKVCNASTAAGRDDVSGNDSYLTPLLQTKPTISMSEFEFTPNTTMDRHLLDLANDSSANMCMEQFSKLRSRSFETPEDLAPQTKKPRQNEVASEILERPLETCMYNRSSPDHRVNESVESLLALSKNEHPLTQQAIDEQGSQREERTSDKQDQIIRRKVQRLSK